MKPVHIAQVSFASYFAHFCTGFIFWTFVETKCFQQRPFGVNLLQNINKFQQAEKKIDNERRKEKKMDGCLNEEHNNLWSLQPLTPRVCSCLLAVLCGLVIICVKKLVQYFTVSISYLLLYPYTNNWFCLTSQALMVYRKEQKDELWYMP